MTDIRALIAEGRAKLAAVDESPTTDRAFDLAEWAGLSARALLDALEDALREPKRRVVKTREELAALSEGAAVVDAHEVVWERQWMWGWTPKCGHDPQSRASIALPVEVLGSKAREVQP